MHKDIKETGDAHFASSAQEAQEERIFSKKRTPKKAKNSEIEHLF